MAKERDRDELDRDAPRTEDDPRGLQEDDELEDIEETDEENLGDEEQYDADEQLTGEVGSEGGSPGETVRTRSRAAGEEIRGSEATETVNQEERRASNVERLGEEDQPAKRNP